MDPTTLMAFIFTAPPEVRTVELLGSWDNFNQPYQMHHDRRRGHGCWSGCFKFDNIIFDGHGIQWTRPRKGGLKQGGTYWYYYRVNYNFDAFDDGQPITTKCPFLPGQTVNVIDVPYELVAPLQRRQSASGDIVGSLTLLPDHEQTMEPEDKFARLEPPPVSKVHSRCLSDEALDGRLEGQQQSPIIAEDIVSPLSSSHSRQLPRQSVDSKMDEYAAKDDLSCAGSVYSQQDVRLLQVGEKQIDDQMTILPSKAALPTIPYPSGLSPTPLRSLEALGAALFASMEHTTAPSSRSSRPLLETRRPSRKRSDSSIGPRSVQNVQFYGSRPGTNLTLDPEQHRPRMYSLPNIEIRDCLDNDVSSMAGTSSSVYSPRRSDDVDENPTPNSEPGNSNHPFAPADDTQSQKDPLALDSPPNLITTRDLDSIVDRLEALGGRGARNNALRTYQPRGYDTRETRLGARSFVNYSLPTIASDSSNSLVKTASTATPRCLTQQENAPPLPAVLAEGQGRSMAEDVFSELGF